MYKKSRQLAITDFEREYIRKAFIECEGNVTRLAREHSLDRVYVHRLLRKHKIISLIGPAEVAKMRFIAANSESPNGD